MAVADDLDQVAELCRTGAKSTLSALLAMGPKPDDPSQAILWEQQTTRLQGQLNSLSALVSKLTAAAVIDELKVFGKELDQVSRVSVDAEARIAKIDDISSLLTVMAKVLDLGLALLAAAAAPSPETIAAVVGAGTTLAGGQ